MNLFQTGGLAEGVVGCELVSAFSFPDNTESTGKIAAFREFFQGQQPIAPENSRLSQSFSLLVGTENR
jgi:hypothetical protein